MVANATIAVVIFKFHMKEFCMDQRAVINLEVKKGEKTFVFSMPVGSPFGEAYDAAFSVLNEIMEMSKKAVEAAKPAEMDAGELQESIEKANKE